MANDANTTNTTEAQADEYIELNGVMCKVIGETATEIVVFKNDLIGGQAYEVRIPKIKPMDTYVPERDKGAGYTSPDLDMSEEVDEDMPTTVDVLPLLEAIDREGVAVINGNIIRNFCYKTEQDSVNWWKDTAHEVGAMATLLRKNGSNAEMTRVEAARQEQRAILFTLSAESMESLADAVRQKYRAGFGETFVNRLEAIRVGDGLKEKAPLEEVEAAHAEFAARLEEMKQQAGGARALALQMARNANMQRKSRRIAFVPVAELADYLNGMMPSMQRRFIEGICDMLHPSKYTKKKADRSETAKRLIGGYNPVRNPNADTYLNANTGARMDERKARKAASRLFRKAAELYAECAAQTYLSVDTRQRIRHDSYRRSDFIGALAIAVAEGDVELSEVLKDERYGYDESERKFITQAVAYVEEHDVLPDYLMPREEIGA